MKKTGKDRYLEKRLKDWSEVLKNDHDYDWAFLIDIIVFKLDRMKEIFDHHGHHTNDKKIARQIGQVSKLLANCAHKNYNRKRIQDDDDSRQKDLDKALSIISKNLFTWWD